MININDILSHASRTASKIQIEYEGEIILGVISNYSYGSKFFFNKENTKNYEDSALLIDPMKLTRVKVHGIGTQQSYYFEGSWKLSQD